MSTAPTVKVDMVADPEKARADVPTGRKAELNPPRDAALPLSWKSNGREWKDGPADLAPVQVDPTIGKDVVYEVTDGKGVIFGAVVRWKPDPPANIKLAPGRSKARVTWDASKYEGCIDYYEVDLDPRPFVAQLPRKVKRAAGTRGTKRVLSLERLPPGMYTAYVSANRESDQGLVGSGQVQDAAGSKEVLPTGGRYGVRARIALVVILGLAAVGGAVYLLVTNPASDDTTALKGWALGIAALVTFAFVALRSVIVHARELSIGAVRPFDDGQRPFDDGQRPLEDREIWQHLRKDIDDKAQTQGSNQKKNFVKVWCSRMVKAGELSDSFKKWYYISVSLTPVVASAVPTLIGFTGSSSTGVALTLRIFAALLGILVATATSVIAVVRVGNRWRLYRTYAQDLEKAGWDYLASKKTDAYEKFVTDVNKVYDRFDRDYLSEVAVLHRTSLDRT